MSEGHGRPMNFPTLLGVYLAVNAIPDAFILGDGPDCLIYKSHFIHGRHDLASTLLRIGGHHRVAFSNVCSRGVVKEHDEIIRRHLRTIDGLKECGLTFVTALPMCSITGVDYGRIIRSLDGKLAKPAIDLPPDSLIGDWLDGYAQVLSALVRGLGLSGKAKARKGPPKTAAIVGYFMDRNEADHLGNLAELRRMLSALGLETVSVWLGGEPAASLKRAAQADLIVSLPYGRAAARSLARATGARLVETELPFGLPKTERFLRDVGQAAGRLKQAESFIASEFSRVIPRLKWIVPQYFLNRRVAFMGDPYLYEGFRDIVEDLGLVLEGAIIRSQHGPAEALCAPPSSSPEVRRIVQAPLDLFVTCWCEQDFHGLRFPVLEFGFPSYRSHALYERPFLGAGGMLAFTERMADKLCAPKEARSR